MRHDPAIKAKARTVFEAKGAKAAAALTGVPAGTIYAWASREHWTRGPTTPATVAEHQPRSAAVTLSWATRKRREADKAGRAAALARELIEQKLTDGADLAPRDLVICYGILIDKALKLGEDAASHGQVWPRDGDGDPILGTLPQLGELLRRATGLDIDDDGELLR